MGRRDTAPFVSAGAGWAFVDTNIPNSRVQIGDQFRLGMAFKF
jgi:hypothetical protein